MSRILTASILCLFSVMVFAHEGHDHGVKLQQAPKGGILRELETINLELLTQGKMISVYVYDKQMKPEDVSKFPVSANVVLPRKGAEPVALVSKTGHWEAEFDPKGAHRFTFILSIRQGGHDDKVKFTVEPKK